MCIRDSIDLGAYAPGRDKLLDEALKRAPAMEDVIRQGVTEAATYINSLAALRAALMEAAA